MLGNNEAIATIAVTDIGAATRFYEDALGLSRLPTEEPGVQIFKSGSSRLLVYESQYAGTNEATAATWIVGDDVEKVVEALRAKGVRFEHYDLPDTTLNGDVHVAGTTRVAWCKDPDGNILAFVNQ
jgi:catechol 2,3-dioxygenase-like lactoylglutathione lyase family enzyme